MSCVVGLRLVAVGLLWCFVNHGNNLLTLTINYPFCFAAVCAWKNAGFPPERKNDIAPNIYTPVLHPAAQFSLPHEAALIETSAWKKPCGRTEDELLWETSYTPVCLHLSSSNSQNWQTASEHKTTHKKSLFLAVERLNSWMFWALFSFFQGFHLFCVLTNSNLTHVKCCFEF